MAVLVVVGLSAYGQNYTPVEGTTTTIFYPSGGYSSVSDPGGPGGAADPGNTGTACGITGNLANNYPNCGCITTITICPDVPGTPIIADFVEFSVNAYFDYVVVYDSNTTAGFIYYDNGSSGSPQYNQECLSPGVITATNSTGCITIEFNASTVISDPGFVANIGVPLPDNVGVVSISPTSPVTPVSQPLEVTVKNFGNNVVDSFLVDWTLNGTPQTGISYNTPLAIGATSGAISLGTFTPASGDVVRAWTSMPNGNTDAFQANDTLSESYCVGLSGNFTINSGAVTGGTNYASFADAISDLSVCGINGPVVFDVVPGSGPYNEQPNLGEVLGNSSVNTITFNGHGETITIAPSTSDEGVFTLSGADYVTLDSLVLVSTSTSSGIGVVITNSSNYNTIQNSTMDMSANTGTSATAGAGVAITDDPGDPYDVGGASGLGNLIQNNIMKGGYYGVVIGGDAAGGSDSNMVLNNVITDVYAYGILVEDAAETVIKGNDISRPTRTGVTTFHGVELDDNTFNTLVEGNRIHNTHGGASSLTGTSYGLYSDGADAEAARPNRFVNNLIYDFNSNGTVYAIYNSGSDFNYYYHNTISLDNVTATGGTTRGFYQTTAATGIEFYNNIISITRGGSGVKYAIYFGTTTSSILSERNDLYVNSAGTGTQGVGYFSIGQTTLADWQSATGQDLTSYDVNPQFSNIAAFNFEPGSGSLNNVGITGLGVTEDFFGIARNLTSPDLGAIEFAGPLNDVGVLSIDSPTPITTATAQNLEVSINNYGRNAVDSLMVTWSLNGVPQNTLNYQTLLPVAGTNSGVIVDTYTPASGDVVQVWTSMPNGVADNGPLNDTATLSFCIGMSGSFTIDQNQPTAGNNFASFQEAIDSMASCGINGPVAFDIVAGSGPYIEHPIIPEINGASATNTITFQGHGDTLAFSATSLDESIIKLDGADWVTIDSLGIGSLSGSYGIGVVFINSADNNTISNCFIDMSLVTGSSSTAGAGIAFTDDDGDPYDAGGSTGSNNLIENNTIIGGYYGVVVAGSSSFGGCESNRIVNNTIADFEAYGVLVEDAVGTQIVGNDISRGGRTDVTTFYGIELDDNTFNTLIDKNKIHDSHSSASSVTGDAYGIYFDGADAEAARPNITTNNLIYDLNGNGTIYAVYNTSSDFSFIVNNTISLDHAAATAGTTRGFYQTTTADSVVFVNNIVSVRRGGSGTKHAIYLNTSTSNVVCDYNDLYVPTAGVSGIDYIGRWDGTDHETLVSWQTSGYGTNSFAVNPRFLDLATFNLEPTSSILNDQAFFVGLTDDHFGATRGLTPDIGAIEYTPAPDDAGVVAFLSPQPPLAPGNADVEVIFRNFGGLLLTEVDLYLDIDDGTSVTSFGPIAYTGGVISSGSDTITLTNFNFTSGSYTLTAWTSLPNGSTDLNTVNDTAVLNFCTALPAGTYTINSTLPTGGTNYQSFGEAAAALQCGILGDIVFEVTYGSGPYNEQVMVFEVPGAGPSATVTFDGQDVDSTLLTHDGSIEYGTFVLNGADYITITNMTIVSTGVDYGFGVQLTDNADHNTISNNVVNVSTTFGTTADVNCITASGSLTNSSTEGSVGSYNLVENNVLNGGEYGIHWESLASAHGFGNRFVGNIISGQDNACIYTDEQDSLIVLNNVITGDPTSTTVDGIYLLDTEGYFEVMGNKVNVYDYGLYVLDANITGGNGRVTIANNFIYSESDYGIYLNDADSVNVYHNSALGEPAMRCNDCDFADVRNNIFIATNDFAYEDDDSGIDYVALDYNIYESGATSKYRLGGTGTANSHASLADWIVANGTFNANSLEIYPTFVNAPSDLHLIGLIGNDVGDNSVGITTDIDGDSRPLAPSTTVDIGADEFAPFDNDIAVVGIVTPVTGSCGDSLAPVEVIIFNNGVQAQTGFPVTADITGALTTTLSITYSQSLASGQFDTIFLGGLNTVNGGTLDLNIYSGLSTDQYLANDTMMFSATVDSLPEAPVAVNDTGCVNESFVLSVGPNTYGETQWYDAAVGGNLVNIGNTYNTPVLSNSTTYYVQGINFSEDTTGMPSAQAGTSTFITQNAGWGVAFEVTSVVTIKSVTVLPIGTGDMTVYVYDLNNSNQVVAQSRLFALTGPAPNVLEVNFTLPPGDYQMGMTSNGITSLVRSSSGVNVPYSNSDGSLIVYAGKTSFTSQTTSSYYWFYDFVTLKQGCASELVPVEAVVSTPVSDAGPNDTICAGDVATLTAANGVAWSWSNSETTQSINVSPTIGSNTYSVTITDQYGCTGTPDIAEVIVNALPNADAGVDDAVCTGTSTTLVATGGVDYEWSTSETTNSISVTPTVDTDYSVTVTDANGCVASDTVTISTYPLPSGNAPADTAICPGEPAALTATGGVSYVWSSGASVPTITVSPSTTTTYTVTTTDVNGCVGQDSVEVTVNQPIALTITAPDTVCIGNDPIVLVGDPVGGTFSGVGVSAGEFNPANVGLGTYTVRYRYTDGIGCESVTQVDIVVTQNNCYTSIDDVSFIETLNVFPNPFDTEIAIELNSVESGIVEIRMLDLLGQELLMQEAELTSGNNSYTIEPATDLAEGFYIIELRKGEQTHQIKMLKAH